MPLGGDRCTSQVSPPPSSRHLRTERSLKSSQASAVADGSCRVAAVLGREHRRGGFGAAQARLKQHEHDRAVERGNLWRVIPAWAGNTLDCPCLLVRQTGHPPRGRGTPLERPSLRGVPRVMGGEHSNCKQLICREFTACKRATEQYTQFGDAI